jgi:hypothetical protein
LPAGALPTSGGVFSLSPSVFVDMILACPEDIPQDNSKIFLRIFLRTLQLSDIQFFLLLLPAMAFEGLL